MTIAEMLVKVGADISEFSAAMEDIKGGLKAAGQSITEAGYALSAAFTAPIVAAGGAILKFGGDFEESMTRVQVLGSTTKEELAALNQQAIQLGLDTVFSAKQAADGMGEMAAAGFKATEIAAAMPGVLGLAASGQTSVAQASQTASDILRGFSIQAKDAGMVADVLAKAAADSSNNVADLGNSFRYIGPVASAAGVDFKETAAALMILGDAGIRGEKAGTGLVQFMQDLIAPSAKAKEVMAQMGIVLQDSTGKMLPLSMLVDQFAKAQQNATSKTDFMAQATSIWGMRTADVLPLLAAGGDKLRALTEGLQNSEGAAKTMGDAMMNNLKGSLNQLVGSLETAAIKFYEAFGPSIKKVVDDITNAINNFVKGPANEFVKWFNSQSESAKKWELGMVAAVAVIGPLTLALGGVMTLLGALTPLLTGAKLGIGLISESFKAASASATAFLPVLKSVAADIGAFVSLASSEGIRGALDATFNFARFTTPMQAFGTSVKTLAGDIGAFASLAKSEGIKGAIDAAFNLSGPMATIAKFKETFTGLQAVIASEGLIGALQGTSVAFTVFGTTLTVSLATIGLVVAAIGALVAAGLWLYKNWDDVVPVLKGLWLDLQNIGQAVFGGLAKYFKEAWDGVTAWAQSVWDATKEYLSGVWQGISATAGSIFGPVLQFFGTMWDGVASYFGKAWSAIADFFKTAWGGIVEGARFAWDWIVEKVKWAGEAIAVILPNTAKAISEWGTHTKAAADDGKKLADAHGVVTDASKKLEDQTKKLTDGIKMGKPAFTGDTDDKLKNAAAAEAARAAYKQWEEALNATLKAIAGSDVALGAAAKTYTQFADRANKGEITKEIDAMTKVIVAGTTNWGILSDEAKAHLGEVSKVRVQYTAWLAEWKASKLATDLAGLEKAINDGLVKPLTAVKQTELPAYLQAVAAEMMKLPVAPMQALMKAAQDFGITLNTDLVRAQQNARKEFDLIVEAAKRGEVSAYSLQAAYVKMLQDQINTGKQLGQDTKALQQELKNAQTEFEKMGGKAKGAADTARDAWKGFTTQVSTIMSDLAKSITERVWGLFTSKNNEELIKQEQDLKTSLADRTKEWEKYQADVTSQLADLTASHAEELERETNKLRSALADKEKEYEQYVQDVNAAIEKLRENNQAELDLEIRDLVEALAQKEEEYNRYVADVGTKIEEITRKHEEELAAAHLDIQNALEDAKGEYERYVQDVNEKIRRIGQNLEDSLNEERTATQRAIEDKKRDFERYQQDIQAKIAEEQAKGAQANQAQIRDWQLALERRRQDLGIFITRANEDLGHFTEDQRRQADQQVADALLAQQRKEQDYQKYVEAMKQKEAEITAKLQAEYDAQIAALQESLKRREEDFNKSQDEIKRAIAEVTADYAKKQQEQEAALRASLADRQKEMENYRAEVAAHIADLTAANKAELDKERAALQKQLADKEKDFQAHMDEMKKKIDELEGKHKTSFSNISGLFTGMLSDMGKALAKWGTEYLEKLLLDKLADLGKTILPGLLSSFKSVFGGVGGDIAGIVKGISGTASESAGAAVKAAQSAAATITAAQNAAKAATDAASAAAKVSQSMGDIAKQIGVPGAVTPGTGTGGSGSLPSTGAGASGFWGPLGAISAAIDAVFTGLSYLTERRMEQDIGRMEVSTRGTLNQTIEMQKTLNTYLPVLGDLTQIKNWYHDWIMDWDTRTSTAENVAKSLLTAMQDMAKPTNTPDWVADVKKGLSDLYYIADLIYQGTGTTGAIVQVLDYGFNELFRLMTPATDANDITGTGIRTLEINVNAQGTAAEDIADAVLTHVLEYIAPV